MTGRIFSIEEFSVYDGPGIRSTVFLKGCPLRCSWCHNPEGQNTEPEIVRSPNGCLGCNACLACATIQNGKTVYTQESIAACPRGLLRLCGETLTAEALCERLMKNARILKMGGGATFSGGEPLAQADFLFACLSILKGKLHTAIQTCGFASKEIFLEALSLADYFLYDLKLADEEAHKLHTGVSNRPILENFARLAQSGRAFTVRIPLIPTVTDTEENIAALARIMKENGVCYAELLPYNRVAGGKYKMLGRDYAPLFDETAPITTNEAVFSSYGIETKLL